MACYISSWLLSESCGLQSGLHDSREMTEGRKEGRIGGGYSLWRPHNPSRWRILRVA